MATNVVVDKGIEGWAKGQKERVGKYHQVFQVGDAPALPERATDKEIAAFCKDNDCDLFTSDVTFYQDYFGVGVDKVQITKIDWWKKKCILLIQT